MFFKNTRETSADSSGMHPFAPGFRPNHRLVSLKNAIFKFFRESSPFILLPSRHITAGE